MVSWQEKIDRKFVFPAFCMEIKVIYDVNQIYLVTHFYNVTEACNDVSLLSFASYFFLSQFYKTLEITV